MARIKMVKCSICNQMITTTRGSNGLNRAPVVCRRCFGDQSYAGSSQWTYNPIVGEPTHSDG